VATTVGPQSQDRGDGRRGDSGHHRDGVLSIFIEWHRNRCEIGGSDDDDHSTENDDYPA
jgi:hypothetical protein